MFNPSRQIREQSLSRRVQVPPTLAKRIEWKKQGKNFALGMGATMAFSYLFEKLSPSTAKESSGAAEGAVGTETANVANTAGNQPGYPPTTGPSYSPPTNPGPYPSTGSSYSAPTNPNYSPSTYASYPPPTSSSYSSSAGPSYSNPTGQTQSGYQRRAVDRDLSGDIFGEPTLSHNL
jgi:hypothetical protein